MCGPPPTPPLVIDSSVSGSSSVPFSLSLSDSASIEHKLVDGCSWAKKPWVQPLEAARVAIPPLDHKPIPLSRLLPWPWSEIFSEEGFSLLIDCIKSAEAGSVPVFDLFASPGERHKIMIALASRNMLNFRSTDAAAVPAPNGCFGLFLKVCRDWSAAALG